MTTQRMRTPRKRKVWIRRETSVDVSTDTRPLVVVDLLSAGLSALGVNFASGVTVMRMVGGLQLVAGAQATSAVAFEARLGVAWLPSQIADASPGDGRIPDPAENGLRQTNWIQQWKLYGIEQETDFLQFKPLDPIERSGVLIDVRQMRKQPHLNAKLALIIDGLSNVEAGTVDLDVSIDCMLALP